jgi:hypothetical protein
VRTRDAVPACQREPTGALAAMAIEKSKKYCCSNGISSAKQAPTLSCARRWVSSSLHAQTGQQNYLLACSKYHTLQHAICTRTRFMHASTASHRIRQAPYRSLLQLDALLLQPRVPSPRPASRTIVAIRPPSASTQMTQPMLLCSLHVALGASIGQVVGRNGPRNVERRVLHGSLHVVSFLVWLGLLRRSF